MTGFVYFSRVEPAEKCYLRELLYWRAFGRLPEAYWDEDGPWRFSPNVREYADGPVPQEPHLTEDECRFAGIPMDPRTEWVESDTMLMDADFYRQQLETTRAGGDPFPEIADKLLLRIRESERQERIMKAWLPYFEDYLDQYMSELCLDLRRGKLVAHGSRLPCATVDESLIDLRKRDLWFDSLEVEPVPADAWVSKHVNWDESWIEGGRHPFLWVHLNVSEMLDIYPPTQIAKENRFVPLGGSIAIVGSGSSSIAHSGSKRGRPTLPWDEFHVEVARLYAAGELPEKQEAAYILLQNWFRTRMFVSAGRSAIQKRLKPYYERLMKESIK